MGKWYHSRVLEEGSLRQEERHKKGIPDSDDKGQWGTTFGRKRQKSPLTFL